MTAPNEQGKEKTWAVLFAGFMALALGGAGFLIAALAVGIEQAWNGGATDRQASRDRSRSWMDNQRSWLNADNTARLARAADYRSWLDGGADPATAPARRSWWSRLRDSGHRKIAATALAGDDFRRGFTGGWKAARTVKRAGGTFKDIARARPAPEGKHRRTPDPVVPPTSNSSVDDPDDNDPGRPDPDNTADPVVHSGYRPRADILKTGDTWAWACRDPHCNGKGFDYPTQDEARNAARRHNPPRPTPRQGPPGPAHIPHQTPAADPATRPNNPNGNPDNGGAEPAEGPIAAVPPKPNTNKEKPMSAPTQPAPAQAPQGDSNAAILRAKLGTIGADTAKVSEHTDALAALQQHLEQTVRDAEEFATATGQSSQARQALDEARALAASMTAALDRFSTAAASTQDSMGQASDGLRASEHADDSLRAAGADYRSVAPAGAHA